MFFFAVLVSGAIINSKYTKDNLLKWQKESQADAVPIFWRGQ